MGDFDRIIKENVEALLLPLAKQLLGITINNPVDLPEKLQTTVEREPDFLKRVSADDGTEFILHLEFQTHDEPKMVYRMAEYKALLQRKFELPVKQFVVYLGTRQPKMRTELKEEEKITGFELKNIHNLPVDPTLASDVPEKVILAILSDYPKADAEHVIARIIQRLRAVSSNEAALKKSIQQLLVLSRLRKLNEETKKQIDAMPITYDIEQDYLYNQGIEKGIEKGIEQGKRLTIIEMLKDPSLPVEKIAHFTGTSVTFIKRVKKEQK